MFKKIRLKSVDLFNEQVLHINTSISLFYMITIYWKVLIKQYLFSTETMQVKSLGRKSLNLSCKLTKMKIY